jgi:titin
MPTATTTTTTTTTPTAPFAPQGVSARAGRGKGVVVSWDEPAYDGGTAITGYRIFRARSPGAEALYATVRCTTYTCTFTNKRARARKMFFYTVAAVNSVGTGPQSTEVSARAR